MSDDGSSFVDEIVGDKPPAHIAPPIDTFLPWHRVRKEFIRRFQWGKITVATIKRYWRHQLGATEVEWSLDEGETGNTEFEIPPNVALDRPLKCLVIPGEDLLDMRALIRDIEPLRCFVRYLGFNQAHGSDEPGTRIHINNNAVTSLPRVARDSYVTSDRFEMIAHQESQARRYMREYGPFHVVILDFCGSICPNTEKDPQEYMNAIHRLLEYQFGAHTSEWLLFVTTEVQPDIVDVARLQDLCKPTRQNFDKHNDFAEALSAVVPAENLKVADATIDLEGLSADQLIALFGISFGKWILQLSQSAQPKWSVAMRPSYRYNISETKGVVMLALAFEFRANVSPPTDLSGVSTLPVAGRTYPLENECAVKLVRSVKAIADVDDRLDADEALHDELMYAQADLLAATGYDREKYISWVKAGEIVA